jgi:hypothetical protein
MTDNHSLAIPRFCINSSSVAGSYRVPARRTLIIPPVPPQGVLDQLPLHAFPCLVQDLWRQPIQGIRLFQVAGAHAVTLGHHYRGLHPILDPADVSGHW